MKRAVFTALALLIACETDSDNASPLGPGGPNVALDGGQADGTTPDVPPVDAATDSGGDVPDLDASDDADASVPLPPPDWYVDPESGDDTNDGKAATAPFKTLCKAREAAQANEVIGLLDGSYGTNQIPLGWAFSFPCGPTFNVPVTLRAMNQGQAIVSVPIAFSQGGAIYGIKLHTERPDGGSLTMGKINVTGGAVTITALTLGDVWSQPNAKSAPIVVSAGTATLEPGNVTNYATIPVPDLTAFIFAIVTGTGEVIMHGGTIDDSAANNNDTYCSPLFEGGGKVTLQGTTVRHKGSIIRSYGSAVFEQGSVLEDRSIAPNLGCSPVIGTLGAVTITVKDSTVRGSGAGIETEPGPGQGTVTVTNSVIEGSSQYGIDAASIGNPSLAVKVRNSQVRSAAVGIRIAGTVTADLGTSADPGGNNFTGSTTTGVRVETTTAVDAAGNTWTANQQTADTQGKYGAGLHVGPLTGINFTLPTASQSIQF